MANVPGKNFKKFGGLFSNDGAGYAKLTYDFDKDGGAAADAIRLGQAAADCLVYKSIVHVEKAATSGGSATVAIGIEGGDVDAFCGTTKGAVANLTKNAIITEDAGQALRVAKDEQVLLDIAVADLTAGKIHVHLWFVNCD